MVEDDIANQAAESVGINEMTVLAIIGIILAGFIVRFLSMAFAPSLLKKIIRSENLQTKTVKQSDKALGSSLGACVSYILSLQLVNSIENGSTTYEMPDIMLTILPNVFQFIIALAVVVWAFRLVNVVQDVVTDVVHFFVVLSRYPLDGFGYGKVVEVTSLVPSV